MSKQQDRTARIAAEAVEGGEDIGDLRVGKLARAGLEAVRTSPRLLQEGGSLGLELLRIAAGRSEVTPDEKDWRFSDPTWSEHPVYRRTAQTYLAWTKALENVVEAAEVDWRTREQARLATSILTSTVAPTNTLPGNPEALKRAFETMGASLVRGTRHFLDDLLHNGGMPQQVDRSPFEVGKNLASTPGSVVYRDEVCELLQYTPTTETVYERPVMMVVPQINKYYFMDLAPGRSFVEYAVSRGLQFFTVSWRNPRPEHADWDLDTYAQAVLEASEAIRDITGSEDFNALSLCAGGVTMAMLLSHLAQHGDERVRSASFGVTLLDFDVPAMIGAFAEERLLNTARKRSASKGVLEGKVLAKIFAWARPNDLVWNYWVNNYLLGNDPPAFDILAWNADTTNLPAALHAGFLKAFGENALCTPGEMTMLGTPVDLSAIKIDSYVTGATTDHLTPWRGCYRTTQLFGGHSTFILSHAGHIQSLINPPGNPKATYWTGPEPGPDPDEWLEQAEQHTGTWWEHWADWVIARSGSEKPAPEELGSKDYPELDPAPGRYVLEPS